MRARTTKRSPLVVGWREWVLMTGLGCAVPVKAKIDTGAATSALHAPLLQIFEREGASWATFTFRPHQRVSRDSMRVEAPIVDERRIRSSNGVTELRPVIETTIAIGDRRWKVQCTLTRRDTMGFRMLLGRQALRRNALVDVGRSYAAGTPYPLLEPPTQGD